jgi:hypothetical protein
VIALSDFDAAYIVFILGYPAERGDTQGRSPRNSAAGGGREGRDARINGGEAEETPPEGARR